MAAAGTGVREHHPSAAGGDIVGRCSSLLIRGGVTMGCNRLLDRIIRLDLR
jgi:hypothetical protein